LLPYGRFTPITVRGESVPLREVIEAVGARLGLVLVSAGDSVELRPVAALERLGRRATRQELALLTALDRAAMPGAGGVLPLADVMERVDLALLELDTARPAGAAADGYHVVFRVVDDLIRQQAVDVPRGATLLGALEAADAQTAATFHPWGASVLVQTDRQLVAQRLDRLIDVRYERADLAQVYADLARRIGLRIAVEPGALRGLAKEQRQLTLTLQNASARQALDAIGGYTGLAYEVGDEGVIVRGPDANFGDDVIGLIQGEAGLWLPIRESEVSEEAAERLRQQKRAALEALEAK
jgi:hypothetical protein